MFVVHEAVKVKVSQLNPVAYNPRKITPEKFEALKASIKLDGFVEPLVVQKKGMRIIGGHQRLKAVKEIAIELGESPPDLPCTLLDIDDKRAKKLNMKLNNVRGENEARMLGELLVDIYDEPTKMTPDDAMSIGFGHTEALDHMYLHVPRPDDVGTMGGGAGGGSEGGGKSFGRSTTLSLEFDSIAMRDRVKKALAEQGKVEKKKTGDVIAGILFRKPKAVKKRTRRAG